MLRGLPQWIEPLRLAQQGCTLQGTVAIAKMTRLHDSLYDMQGEVYIDWAFAMDAQHRPTIQGPLKADISLQCQRCLQPMPCSIDIQVSLILATQQAQQEEEDLLDEYDVLTLPNTPVSLIALIEDELILALPIVPRHEVCPSNEYALPADDKVQAENPFSILRKLKEH